MNRLLPIARVAVFHVTGYAMAQQAAPEAPAIRAGFEGKPWAVQLIAPGFELQRNGVRPDGRVYLLARRGAFGLSIMLEKVHGTATDDGCVKTFAARAKGNSAFKPVEVTQSRLGKVPTLEYLIAEAGGVQVRQKSLLGCLAREDVYADIHLSKMRYDPADREELLAILSSASIIAVDPASNAQPPTVSSLDLMEAGSRFFLRRDYGKAIASYQPALDLEEKEQKLTPTLWRVLIDNLAMAYGLSGNEGAAEKVLKYGISKDPAYPMFYYLMADVADVYGERNDLNKAMEYPRLALANKENVNAGEALPDPLEDDSFKRFRKNAEFRKLAAQFE